jgi:hypothetical protein
MQNAIAHAAWLGGNALQFEPKQQFDSKRQTVEDFMRITRVVRDRQHTLEISTETFLKGFRDWTNRARFQVERECYLKVSVLAEVVDAQKRMLDYQGCYLAHVLGQTSEEEFAEEANSFAWRAQNIDPQRLAEKINIVIQCTKSEFSTSEFCEFFQATEKSVEAAVEQLTLFPAKR